MASQQPRRYFPRSYHAAPVAKLAAFVVGLVVSAIALALVGRAPLNAGVQAGSAPNAVVSSPIEATQPGLGTAAAMPAQPAATAAQRAFDYFPDHYINQATKIEDPVATF